MGKVNEITMIASNQSGPMSWVGCISLKNMDARRMDRYLNKKKERKDGVGLGRLPPMFAMEKL